MRGTIALAAMLAIAWPGTAYAYLDPATGGIFLQLLFGGVAGILVFFRLFWRRLSSIVLSLRRPRNDAESSLAEQSDPEEDYDAESS